MIYLKVAAVITLIVSLLISPTAKECVAHLKYGVHCKEKATHNGYCAQHFKE